MHASHVTAAADATAPITRGCAGGVTAKKMVLVVAAALIDGPRVLLAQRPPGGPMAGLWEFPGGKVRLPPSVQTSIQQGPAASKQLAWRHPPPLS